MSVRHKFLRNALPIMLFLIDAGPGAAYQRPIADSIFQLAASPRLRNGQAQENCGSRHKAFMPSCQSKPMAMKGVAAIFSLLSVHPLVRIVIGYLSFAPQRRSGRMKAGPNGRLHKERQASAT